MKGNDFLLDQPGPHLSEDCWGNSKLQIFSSFMSPVSVWGRISWVWHLCECNHLIHVHITDQFSFPLVSFWLTGSSLSSLWLGILKGRSKNHPWYQKNKLCLYVWIWYFVGRVPIVFIRFRKGSMVCTGPPPPRKTWFIVALAAFG